MSVSNNKNRGAHGDSSFKLGGMPSSSENPLASAMGSVNSEGVMALCNKPSESPVNLSYQRNGR